MIPDTIAVRPGEGLPVEQLASFLRAHIVDLPADPLTVTQFPTGHSNLTYALRVGDWEGVLRRPPLGPVAPKAHDMQREYRVMAALHFAYALVPKPYVCSDDTGIIGSPFFVMERRHGVVLDTAFPTAIAPTPTLGRQLSELMVEHLVRLHDVDYTATPLVDMTRPAGFMARQVEGWIARYLRAKTDDVQGVERLMKWLTEHVPSESAHTVIHYDYKLNNAMFNDDLSEMVGLFDWEMATVGDPLADVGAAMSYWIEADDPALLKTGLGKPPVTVLEGFMTRRAFIEAYARKSGRDVSHIHFYLTFAYFKLAVIVQQIYYRWRMGQTDDERFRGMNDAVAALVAYAAETIGNRED